VKQETVSGSGHQLGHMQVCTSLQTDNCTSTPPLSFLQTGCPSCRQTKGIKALEPTKMQKNPHIQEALELVLKAVLLHMTLLCHLVVYSNFLLLCSVSSAADRWGAGVVICLELGADLHMAQLMPVPLTVSCFSKIQIGFTFLVPAHPGSPGKTGVCVRCQNESRM